MEGVIFENKNHNNKYIASDDIIRKQYLLRTAGSSNFKPIGEAVKSYGSFVGVLLPYLKRVYGVRDRFKENALCV